MKKYCIYSLCLATLLTACGGKEEEKTEKTETVPVVKVETVNSRIVDQIGVYTATVDPEIVNNISSSMPLPAIMALTFSPGSMGMMLTMLLPRAVLPASGMR